MPTTNKIRLGTRASQLAMWQSRWVQTQLVQLGCDVELIPIKTTGDVQTQPLAQIGGQGLFTKRLQDALLNNEIDLAVHSLKDLPTEDHPELTIAAIPKRENRFDVLVSNRFDSLETLPANAVIGTGSVRRAAQLLHLRGDLKIEDIRGNVDTRLSKLDDGQYDAIILAAAGLLRLGLEQRIACQFEPPQLLPAVGQGALGLETRANDRSVVATVTQLNHEPSYYSAICERAMLRHLFAGCLAPVGANTVVENDQLKLSGVVLSRDGIHRIFAETTGRLREASQLGIVTAEKLIQNGAEQFLTRESVD